MRPKISEGHSAGPGGRPRPGAADRSHDYASCCIVAGLCPAPPSTASTASTPNNAAHRGFRGVGLRRRRTLRLAAIHPDWEVTLATAETQAGGRVGDLYPSLAAVYPDLALTAADPAAADGLDVVFLALPHGASQDLVPELRKRVGLVVDLAADFRLREPDLYPRWYGSEHRCPDLLAEAVTGSPSCFRTSCPAPLWWRRPGATPRPPPWPWPRWSGPGWWTPQGIVVDAASGVSGAGRVPKAAHPFQCRRRRLHRLRPAQPPAHAGDRAGAGGGRPVIFTPHLAPMNRGILATCYARPAAGPAGVRRLRPPRPARRAGPLLPGLPLHRRRRAIAVHQSHPGLQLRPSDGPLRPSHGLDRGHCGHRQPHQGRGRPGHPVRQPGPRPARDVRPAADGVVPVTADSRAGDRRPNPPRTTGDW